MTDAGAASSIPTFKLVLVGDGGTGKVRRKNFGRPHGPLLDFYLAARFFFKAGAHTTNTSIATDDLRQAPLDWRVREEVHRYSWC